MINLTLNEAWKGEDCWLSPTGHFPSPDLSTQPAELLEALCLSPASQISSASLRPVQNGAACRTLGIAEEGTHAELTDSVTSSICSLFWYSGSIAFALSTSQSKTLIVWFYLKLFWSWEISLAENYGFHFKTEEGVHNLTKMPCWKAGDVLELCTKSSSKDTVAQELPACCQETWIPAAWLPFTALSHGKAGKALLCKAPNLDLSAWFQNWLIARTTLPVQDSKCFLFQRTRQVKMWSVIMYLSSFMWKCMPFKKLSEPSLLHYKLCYFCDSVTAW